MNSKTLGEIKRVNGTPIVDLNASWTSAPIPMAEFKHIGAHLGWDNIAVQGTLRLQYSCDPSGDGNDVNVWTDKTVVNVDGTFTEALFLDSNLAVGNVRLVWAFASGSASLETYITRKD